MRLSFGKPIGTAAIVNKGDVILYIRCDPSAIELAKKALKKAASKISVKTRIRVVQ
jgi:large subunit ribosomal protein L10e